MRVGVFTALLAQLSLDDVLKKLKSLNVDTVELGTGNYPLVQYQSPVVESTRVKACS